MSLKVEQICDGLFFNQVEVLELTLEFGVWTLRCLNVKLSVFQDVIRSDSESENFRF